MTTLAALRWTLTTTRPTPTRRRSIEMPCGTIAALPPQRIILRLVLPTRTSAVCPSFQIIFHLALLLGQTIPVLQRYTIPLLLILPYFDGFVKPSQEFRMSIPPEYVKHLKNRTFFQYYTTSNVLLPVLFAPSSPLYGII